MSSFNNGFRVDLMIVAARILSYRRKYAISESIHLIIIYLNSSCLLRRINSCFRYLLPQSLLFAQYPLILIPDQYISSESYPTRLYTELLVWHNASSCSSFRLCCHRHCFRASYIPDNYHNHDIYRHRCHHHYTVYRPSMIPLNPNL